MIVLCIALLLRIAAYALDNTAEAATLAPVTHTAVQTTR